MKANVCSTRRFFVVAVSLSAAVVFNPAANGQPDPDFTWHVDDDADPGVIHQAFIALPDRAGSDFFRIIRLAA